jgi:hypothetical protein
MAATPRTIAARKAKIECGAPRTATSGHGCDPCSRRENTRFQDIQISAYRDADPSKQRALEMTESSTKLSGQMAGFRPQTGIAQEQQAVADHNFILAVNDNTHPATVEKIGRKLLELNGQGVHCGARSMDVVLQDVLKGIRDKVLLKTSLTPAELEHLLKKQLRGDFKKCTIEWMTAG